MVVFVVGITSLNINLATILLLIDQHASPVLYNRFIDPDYSTTESLVVELLAKLKYYTNSVWCLHSCLSIVQAHNP